jgi:hypothetical protein
MKEEVRQSALQEADLPAIFHKTWQAENPDFLLGLHPADVCLPESLTKFRALCGFM